MGDHRLLAALRAVTRLIKDIKAGPEVDGLDHRPLPLAALKVAVMAIEATIDDLCWPLSEAAVIIGEALAKEADNGPEDGANTIWVSAEALARAEGVDDYDHPAPDFASLRDLISKVVQRSTGDDIDRNGRWTALTLWKTNGHDPTQAAGIMKIAPIVAEVAENFRLGRPMSRNSLEAIQ
ncbi:hypothetical protein GCM10009069_05380 [Algimonas arctica]|uniref:Uncharacterized protein n=1 Tax=Algimonas arctica TaxID=1479486 RepID=A0A8J3G1H5_9PROT|nr:hypothetical protein [Algimonas arctica]GHA85182.1 hypothetical protein GCM10009069_05380 [Algimonas arctica]